LGYFDSRNYEVDIGRQINYLVLPDEFPELVAAVTKAQPAAWMPRLHRSRAIEVWDQHSARATGDEGGWLLSLRDVPRFMEQELSWWEPRKRFVASAGAYGLEMSSCWFDGKRLIAGRIYFNTLPPVDPDVSRWANRVISAARRFLVTAPNVSVYCGPRTAEWIVSHDARPVAGGTEVVIA
jgi:hypothetical protein